MFLNVWKAIDHMIILALSYFRYNSLLSTGEYLLTQLWTVKLLIRKPQPRRNNLSVFTTQMTAFKEPASESVSIEICIKCD